MLSLFELFKIGIGPSSSHTVGPMIAAGRFVRRLEADGLIGKVESVEVDLFGSLALTGKGHATDQAVLGGLLGFHPASLDLEQYGKALEAIEQTKSLPLLGGAATVPFDPRKT
ncbi:MAG: serine dehydratase beta chain, partial [Pirellulaceae bacterium]